MELNTNDKSIPLKVNGKRNIDAKIHPYHKQKIPKALREQVWIQKVGRNFDAKCRTDWCKNRMNVFNFHCGHNIPESKGGATTLENLIPICSNCNLSMGSQHTFDEWCQIYKTSKKGWKRFFTCIH